MKKILIAIGAVLLMAFNVFAETSREYLQTIDLNDLRIEYSENRQGFWVVIVTDPDGYLHTVTEGSYIGKDFGRVMKITNDTVEVLEIVPDGAGGYVERPLTLEVACPDIPPCANSPSDGSRIVWLVSKGEKVPYTKGYRSFHLGLSVGDRRVWRWVDSGCRGIQPATSEEAKELMQEYGDVDLSRFRNDACPTPR